MSVGGADDVYEVVFKVDDSDEAKAVRDSMARARQLDAQWQSSMTANNRRWQEHLAKMREANAATDQGAKSTGGFTGKILEMVAAFGTVASAVSITQALSRALNEGVKEADALAQKSIAMRDSLREVAGVQGQAGVSDKLVQSQLDMMRQAGMTMPEAATFRAEFLGEAEAYRGRVAPEEFERLQVESARLATPFGIKPDVMAKLSGRLLGQAPEGTTADEVMAQAAEVQRLLQLGSGNTSQLMQSYLNASASLVPTGQTTARNLGAMAMSASRLGAPHTVDTTVQQFARGVMGQTGSTEWNRFVREELGVTGDMKVEQAMMPVFERLETEQAQGKNLSDFLQESGMGQEELRRSILGMYGQRREMMEQINAPQQAGVSPEQFMRQQYVGVQKDIKRATTFETATPEMQSRIAEAEVSAAEFEAGRRNQEAQIYRRRAYASLLKSGELGPETKAQEELQDMLSGKFVHGVTTGQIKIEQRAYEMAQRQMKTAFLSDVHGEEGDPIKGADVNWDRTDTRRWIRRVQGFELQANIERARDDAVQGNRSRALSSVGFTAEGAPLTEKMVDILNQINRKQVPINQRLTRAAPASKVKP